MVPVLAFLRVFLSVLAVVVIEFCKRSAVVVMAHCSRLVAHPVIAAFISCSTISQVDFVHVEESLKVSRFHFPIFTNDACAYLVWRLLRVERVVMSLVDR